MNTEFKKLMLFRKYKGKTVLPNMIFTNSQYILLSRVNTQFHKNFICFPGYIYRRICQHVHNV